MPTRPPATSATGFDDHFEQARTNIFRLETLQNYGNSGEDPALAAFLAGQPHLITAAKRAWTALVRERTAAGCAMQRVHVVNEPITDYLRFELTWGYQPNVEAGEDIGIIPVTVGQQWPPELPESIDFWLFDHSVLYALRYDQEGAWQGTEQVTDPGAIAQACVWREAALRHAVPWRSYIEAPPHSPRAFPEVDPERPDRKGPWVALVSPHRARLAARLRSLRAAVAPSGNQFATRIGWQQSRVSKLETGKQLPTEADIHAWVAVTGSSESVEIELLGLLAAARIEYVTHRDEARTEGSLAQVQQRQAVLESQVTHIAEWQPAMVPGLVQTAAYTRELLERPDRPTMTQGIDPEAVAIERIRRQDILYQPERRIEIIVGEAALRSTPGTIPTLLGQLDRLVSVSDLPSVTFGIIPFPMMPVMPLSSFCMRDDVVYIETLTGEQQLYEPDEVAVYRKAFELLRAVCRTGPDAMVLIQRIATELRGLM